MFLKILILLSYNIFYELLWVHLIFFFVSQLSRYQIIHLVLLRKNIVARVLSINYNSYYPIVAVNIFFNLIPSSNSHHIVVNTEIQTWNLCLNDWINIHKRKLLNDITDVYILYCLSKIKTKMIWSSTVLYLQIKCVNLISYKCRNIIRMACYSSMADYRLSFVVVINSLNINYIL